MWMISVQYILACLLWVKFLVIVICIGLYLENGQWELMMIIMMTTTKTMTTRLMIMNSWYECALFVWDKVYERCVGGVIHADWVTVILFYQRSHLKDNSLLWTFMHFHMTCSGKGFRDRKTLVPLYPSPARWDVRDSVDFRCRDLYTRAVRFRHEHSYCFAHLACL